MGVFTSKEILQKLSDSAIGKCESRSMKILILAILAGAYIAFGAQASAMASFNLCAESATTGVGKLVAGCVFPIGLILVVLCGAELFTGNCLMVVGLMDKKVSNLNLIRNLVIVYIGNFIGSLLMVFIMSRTGLWDTGDGLLGAIVVRTAAKKCSLSFGNAFFLGILCNWLVCLAVYLATGAKDMMGKIAALWFPIMIFVMSGFEHSIANMYFIPAGIIASANDTYVGLLNIDISALTIGNFLIKNLLPVTLGNIVGGSGFVGMLYWLAYKKFD